MPIKAGLFTAEAKLFIPTFIKDSNELLGELDNEGQLLSNPKAIAMDTISIYTNINMKENYHLQGFPLQAIKKVVALVMQNNIFE